MNLYCVWAAATSANLTLAAQRPEWFSPFPWPFLVTLVAIGVVAGMRKIGKPKRFLFAAVMLSSMLGIAGSESQGPGALFDWLASLGLSQEAAHLVTVGIRKAIHFGFFGTLAWTAFHASNSVLARAQAIMWSLCLSIGFAAMDEWRQTFSIGRTGTFWDVLLDAAGAATCVALAAYRLKQPDSEREKIPTSL
jgi:VanZ family protein